MQLDRTTIAIRQRPLVELSDMTLRVIREYAGPVLAWGTASLIPFAILNALVLMPVLRYDTIQLALSVEVSESLLRTRYNMLMAALVFLEAPFVFQAITYFLGEAVFVEKPSPQAVLKYLRANFSRSIWYLGIVRLGLLGLPACLLFSDQGEFSPWIEIGLIGCFLVGISYMVRGLRPFAPEILFLEQPFAQGDKPARTNYRKRNRNLHAPMSSDLFGISILKIVFLLGAWFALDYFERCVVGLVLGIWDSGWWTDILFTPINFWILAMFSTVFRFLHYLDTRIRLEGWEVELRLTAEAERLEARSL